ncbi:radical SAM protein [Candidatus Parcubacteria bacterium]|nr:MAG: radical SAM protein [Candidatus Parcubacteria bacterium]
MKIFILNPFLFSGKLSRLSRKRQPLDLAYMASLLRKEHKIKLLDANALSLSLEDTIEEIKLFLPEVLILTSTPLDRWEVPSHAHLKLLIKNIIKTIDSVDIKYTILTGAHGTVMPEWILKKSSIDYVIRGEPEIIAVNLINAMANNLPLENISGISYVKEGKIINNKDAERINDLDSLPFPAYDLLPMEKYRYTFPDIPSPFSLMLSSRGCPFNCTYCLKAMMDKLYIARSPENVVAEMEFLQNNFGIKGIYFQDWEFLINKDRVRRICYLIKEKNINVSWGCNVRAGDLDDETVSKMKESGCVRINIGFESGSQKVLDMAEKKITVDQIKEAVNICRRYDINMGIYSILNLPGEDRRTIAETEKFLAENNLKTMCEPNLPIPYFGTKMYKMLVRQEGYEFDWENLEKFAGRVGVSQPPWLAKIYRWHYKFRYSAGAFYFLHPKFYGRLARRFKDILLKWNIPLK